MLSITEAKSLILEKYGFTVIEKPDLGKTEKGETIKGLAYTDREEIIIRADLDDSMKLIAIAHETGHLIDDRQNDVAWLHSSGLKLETRAWINGLDIAAEMGIAKEYKEYWKIRLNKI